VSTKLKAAGESQDFKPFPCVGAPCKPGHGSCNSSD